MNFFFQKADFKPNKLDARFSLKKRFSSDSVMCFNLLSDELEYYLCRIQCNEVHQESLPKRLKFKNQTELITILTEIHQEYGTSYCSCAIDENFEVLLLQRSLQEELHRGGFEYTPSVLGPAFEKDKKYIHFSNAQFNKTLLFSFSRHHILQLTDTINKGGFILAQLGCGVYNLLRYHVFEAKNTERNLNALLVIAQKCVVLLKLQGSDWCEVSFRYILEAGTSPLSIIDGLVQRLEINGTIGYYCLINEDAVDQINNRFSDIIYVNQGSFSENLLLMHNINKE